MKYVAFLRGIGPGDPRMRNDQLRSVFERLGYRDVQSVISSGNILFTSDDADLQNLERDCKEALELHLERPCATFIRSQDEIEHLVTLQPFGEMVHSPKTYLMVTLLKSAPSKDFKFPYHSDDGTFALLDYDAKTRALFSVTDASIPNVSNVMPWVDKQFGKTNSSRTWNTILRIDKKLHTTD